MHFYRHALAQWIVPLPYGMVHIALRLIHIKQPTKCALTLKSAFKFKRNCILAQTSKQMKAIEFWGLASPKSPHCREVVKGFNIYHLQDHRFISFKKHERLRILFGPLL